MGLEPTTLRLRVSCSTDWASRAVLYLSSYQQYRWRCCSQNSFCFRHTCLQFNLVLGNLWLSIPLLQAWKYYYEFLAHQAVVAEWLRRLTRNQFPSGSVGSNPGYKKIKWFSSKRHLGKYLGNSYLFETPFKKHFNNVGQLSAGAGYKKKKWFSLKKTPRNLACQLSYSTKMFNNSANLIPIWLKRICDKKDTATHSTYICKKINRRC